MNTMMTVNGSAVVMAAVCNAVRPPSTSRSAATTPSVTAQNTRLAPGGSGLPSVDRMSMTREPESDEVMKNVATRSVATTVLIAPQGSPSSMMNTAGAISPETASTMPPWT